MKLCDHTMRELVAVMGAPRKYAPVPQVQRPEEMTDEEFYDWLDGDLMDCEMTRFELDADDAAIPMRGEI